MRVAIYLRVSTAEQGRRGFSLAEQRRACLERAQTLARRTGLPVDLAVEEFVDTAGGDLLERPELERARRFVREARPDCFICLDPDRFSRATYQAILIANEIEAAGTKLEFVQHEYQSTSEGRLFFTLRVAIAEYEKAKILERTMRGKRGKMAAGGIPHGISVYGYDFRPAPQRQRAGEADACPLAPNPLEAAWVRQIFQWVAREGVGIEAVTARLNRLAVPAKRGGRWRRGVVAALLHNPIYCGRLRLNRYDFTGLGGQLQLPPDRRTRKLTPRQRPAAEWIEVGVPAIVSDALFAEAQQRLARRRSALAGPPDRPPRLLSGLALCGLCGAPMHYAWSQRSDGYLLRCANRYPEADGQPCRHPHRRAGPIEEAALARVREWLLNPDLLAAHATERPPGGDDPAAELEAQLRAAKERQARLLDMVGRGVVQPDVAEAQLQAARHHAEALERERLALQPEEPAPASPEDWQARLEALRPTEWQAVLRLLVGAVVISPGLDHPEFRI